MAGQDVAVEAVGPQMAAFTPQAAAPAALAAQLTVAGAYLLHVRLAGAPLPGWPRVLHVLAAPSEASKCGTPARFRDSHSSLSLPLLAPIKGALKQYLWPYTRQLSLQFEVPQEWLAQAPLRSIPSGRLSFRVTEQRILKAERKVPFGIVIAENLYTISNVFGNSLGPGSSCASG